MGDNYGTSATGFWDHRMVAPFDPDKNAGAGLHFGVWLWGTLLVIAMLCAFIQFVWAFWDLDLGVSAALVRVADRWTIPIGALAVIWKVFHTKHSEVAAWSRKLEMLPGDWLQDTMEVSRAVVGKWLRRGVEAWGIVLAALILLFLILLGFDHPTKEVAKALAPIIAAAGVVWQVFLSAAVDERMAYVDERVITAEENEKVRYLDDRIQDVDERLGRLAALSGVALDRQTTDGAPPKGAG